MIPEIDPDRPTKGFASLHPALACCAAGTLPPNVALLRLVMEAAREEDVEALLLRAREAVRNQPAGLAFLETALALWRANPQAFSTVKATLSGVEHEGAGGSLMAWGQTFDRLAEDAPEGSVALYALGNPDLLRAATEEVVERLAAWGVLRPGTRVLEIGCGIGRFVAALAPRVAWVTGLDLSAGMIARARERCAGLVNVTLAVTGGQDLSGIPDTSQDLVLAADVFPYLVQTGLARAHVAEGARVLAPGGGLVIFNYSYRGDDALDRQEVEELATEAGLEVRCAGARDLALWDAPAFLLVRP